LQSNCPLSVAQLNFADNDSSVVDGFQLLLLHYSVDPLHDSVVKGRFESFMTNVVNEFNEMQNGGWWGMRL
jgi:hypothetical protein